MDDTRLTPQQIREEQTIESGRSLFGGPLNENERAIEQRVQEIVAPMCAELARRFGRVPLRIVRVLRHRVRKQLIDRFFEEHGDDLVTQDECARALDDLSPNKER